MKRRPLPPLEIPWKRKSVETAKTSFEVLADGRLRLAIEHQVLRGVTPAMLRWWFANIEGQMEFDGQRLERYRVWHPIDHISFRCVRRASDGSVGSENLARRRRGSALITRLLPAD